MIKVKVQPLTAEAMQPVRADAGTKQPIFHLVEPARAASPWNCYTLNTAQS
jgi:hypothetical protein